MSHVKIVIELNYFSKVYQNTHDKNNSNSSYFRNNSYQISILSTYIIIYVFNMYAIIGVLWFKDNEKE